MEILIELMFFPIGWAYLLIKYRNRKKMKQVLIEKYENSYIEAGRVVISDTAYILWGAFLVVALLVVIVAVIASFFD